MSFAASTRIVIATEPVDLRRGHDGLVTLVRSLWKEDPYCGAWFVFFGRKSGPFAATFARSLETLECRRALTAINARLIRTLAPQPNSAGRQIDGRTITF
jgi:transposase